MSFSQVEAVATLVNGIGESVLFTTLQRLQRDNPQGSQQDHIRQAARQLVPMSVPGSPAYHRAKLQDLLAIVSQHGIPDLFLTLTADEISHMAWTEVKAIEQLACNLTGCNFLTWRDLPCEMARLFVDRVNTFMRQHVLTDQNPILGSINHWVVRYESQVSIGTWSQPLKCFHYKPLGLASTFRHFTLAYHCPPQFRGSLHAHIMLWVKSTHLPTVKNEITATRCRYRAEQQQDGSMHLHPDVPTDSDNAAARLLAMVDAKQIHVCRTGPGGCRHQRQDCKYGFPFSPHHSGTEYDEATKR